MLDTLRNLKIIGAVLLAGALIGASLAATPSSLWMQSGNAASQAGAAASPAPLLKDQQTRGENLFRQRCSVCHLPRELKFGSPPVIGPSLRGVFELAGPDRQSALRETILKGGAAMPGFQYGLEPKQVDDLIAFLKAF